MTKLNKEVKSLHDELDKIERQIRDNKWDDAFTSPSMVHQDFMSELHKKRNEIKKKFDEAIDRL